MRAPRGPHNQASLPKGARAVAQWARGPPGGAVGARTALQAPGRRRAQPGRPGTFSSRSPYGPHGEPLPPLCTGERVSSGHRQPVRVRGQGRVPVPPSPRLGRERRTGARAARPEASGAGRPLRPERRREEGARGPPLSCPRAAGGGRRPTRAPWLPGPRGREAAAPGLGPPSELLEVSIQRGRRGWRGRRGEAGEKGRGPARRSSVPALCGVGAQVTDGRVGVQGGAPAPRRGFQGMRAAGGGRVGRGPWKRGVPRVAGGPARSGAECVWAWGWGRGAFYGPERTFVRAPLAGR